MRHAGNEGETRGSGAERRAGGVAPPGRRRAENGEAEGGGGGRDAHEARRRRVLPVPDEVLGAARDGGAASHALLRGAGLGSVLEADAVLRGLRDGGEHKGVLGGHSQIAPQFPRAEHVRADVAAQDLSAVSVAAGEGAERGEGTAADRGAEASVPHNAGEIERIEGEGGGEGGEEDVVDRSGVGRGRTRDSVYRESSEGAGEVEGSVTDKV